jgi:AGZA family xanthine/uracil permease-like MFS transporter
VAGSRLACRGTTVETAPAPSRPRTSAVDSWFEITARGSSLEREVRGGLTTFFTMAYIVVLNPLILGFALDGDGHVLGGGSVPGSGIPKIAAATALVAAVMTILMGVVGR